MQMTCYNGHPDNTDSSQIPHKNKSQILDWNELPLLWTLANDYTNSYSVRCEGISL